MDKIRILVIEDEAITAMDIKARLEKLNYSVIATLFSGEDAVVTASELKPDLVLMDIVLKGKMDGTEAAQIISNKHHIPVIFLTAYNDNKTFDRAKLSMPYGYLTKPFETRDLQIAIELALFRHEMEGKLAISEKRYTKLMDNASCGVVIHNANGIIMDINKQGALIADDKKENIIGRDFRKYIHPDDMEYAGLQLAKVVVEERIDPNEIRVIHKDNTVLEVVFSSSKVMLGKEEVFITILTDVTEKNKLRAQALLNDKLAMMGTLSSGVIHEINNPLSWILGTLTELKKMDVKFKQFDEKLALEFSEMTDEIYEGAKRIQHLVQDLKGFARIDDAELKPVNIVSVLKAVINMLSGEIKNHVTVETDFQENLPLIITSESKMQQVFLNVILNAIQACSGNTGRQNVVSVSASLNRNRVYININDNGTGIHPNNYSKIFTPFFTTKPSGKGSGLGLSICKDILSHLDATIQFESTLGKGTTFTICLPLRVKLGENGDKSPIIIKKADNSRLKILIIDDEPLLLKSLKRLLSDSYDVITTGGGKEALVLLEKHTIDFDVIISDMQMPDISGADFYQYISKKYPGLERRVIFLTGSLFSKQEDEFFKSITNPRLAKPFEHSELLEKIAEVGQGKT